MANPVSPTDRFLDVLPGVFWFVFLLVAFIWHLYDVRKDRIHRRAMREKAVVLASAKTNEIISLIAAGKFEESLIKLDWLAEFVADTFDEADI